MRIFGKEKIKKLVKISNTQVQLPSGSLVHLGGSAHKLGNPVLDTSIIGAGGIESTTSNNVMYHAYAILDSGIVKLIASESNEKPNYKRYRKVGGSQQTVAMHTPVFIASNTSAYMYKNDVNTTYANGGHVKEHGWN